MPINNQINRGEYQRQLARAFILRETAPAPQLAPDIQPVVIVENLAQPGPFSRETIRRCSTFQAVAAVAAEFSFCVLHNPLGSGILAAMRYVAVSRRTAGAQSFVAELRTQNPGLAWASDQFRQFWDTRLDGRPKCEAGSDNTPGGLLTFGSSLFQVASQEGAALDVAGMILKPDTFLVIQAANVNVDFDTTWVWDEFVNPEP